jgi:hypothetical protein
VIAWVID